MKKGNLKIRMKEFGSMRGMLIAKGMQPKSSILEAGAKQLLEWMYRCYGYRHHRLWKLS